MKNPHAVQGVGASDRASTEHCTTTQVSVLDPVAAFMPWVQDTERGLRRRLLTFQQRAGTRARQSGSDQARTIWWIICDTAARQALAPTSPSQLQDVLTALARMSLSADAFERWEAPRG